ncbi:MAG: hypothetical protein AB7H97_22435 [Pseudobdellovibrionaceae bacterium]
MIQSIFISLIFALSLKAFAKGEVEPTFGGECTVTNDDIIELDLGEWHDREDLQRTYSEKIYFWRLVFQAKEKRFAALLDSPLTENDVRWKTDVAVLECNTAPRPYLFYAQNELEYESLIFSAAWEAGLRPDDFIGGGHIHIGTVFKDDPQLLRDFTVDFMNNPALSMGIFHYNPLFALHIADADPFRQLRFLQMIRRFDADKAEGYLWSARRFAEEFHGGDRPGQGVFEDFVNPFAKSDVAEHHDLRNFALNLRNFIGSSAGSLDTAEIRAILPQKNFHDFVLQIRLFRARLKWLVENSNQQPRFVTGPRTLNESRAEFRRYVEECGLDWEEYKHFQHPDWARLPDRTMRKDPFELYKYTKKRKAALLREYEDLAQQACEALVI